MTKRDYDESRQEAARMLNAMRGVRHYTRMAAYDAAILYLSDKARQALGQASDYQCKGLHEMARYSRARGHAALRAATLLANRLGRL